MVDRRIVPDLRWIAQRFPIYVTDGYSGPLPDGEHVGCHGCHVKHSDHYNGLAVDIVPAATEATAATPTGAAITRLAHWAEPLQNRPRAPFRWVGYDGDAGHGCGNHLHLSWDHAPAPQFQLAEWVEVFPTGGGRHGKPASRPRPPASSRSPPPAARAASRPSAAASLPRGERLVRTQAGGVSPRDCRSRIGGRCAASCLPPIARPLAARRLRLRPTTTTPVACLEGASAYLAPSTTRPARCELSGETPISDCLAENQKGGDLATVGDGDGRGGDRAERRGARRARRRGEPAARLPARRRPARRRARPTASTPS